MKYTWKEVEEEILYQNISDKVHYCLMESHQSAKVYEAILKQVLSLDEKPKRVIDVGSNLNLFGYLFANEGIEYIGIDKAYIGTPFTGNLVKFIHAPYKEVANEYANDVVISCLCVGYQVPIDVVQAKHLIINAHDVGAIKLW